MAEITAKLVNELRARTNVGMMECKKALVECAGDIEKAIEYFRKKGVKTSVTERAANEGRVFGYAAPDGSVAAAVVVNCNTDFTAKSEPFQNLGKQAAESLARNSSAPVATNPAIAGALTALAQTTGENCHLGSTAAIVAPAGGKAGLYIYNITGKIAVLMAFKGNPSAELLTDLGGHIAFSKPLGLTRNDVPAELVAKEKEIAVEQAKATGKPQNIAEKIAEGKLGAFFKERVLLDQDFFNAGKFKGSITEMLKAQSVTLEKYVRVEVGQ